MRLVCLQGSKAGLCKATPPLHSQTTQCNANEFLWKRPSVSLPNAIHNALVTFLIAPPAQGLKPGLHHCKRTQTADIYKLVPLETTLLAQTL